MHEGLAKEAGFVTACEHPWNLQGGKAKVFALDETTDQNAENTLSSAQI